MTYAWVAALFLPLFPFSMLLNLTVSRLGWPVARFVLLLAWPQFGVAILILTDPKVPAFVVPWALASSALYALRLLTVRDLGLWAGFLAASVWPLTWGFEPVRSKWIVPSLMVAATSIRIRRSRSSPIAASSTVGRWTDFAKVRRRSFRISTSSI